MIGSGFCGLNRLFVCGLGLLCFVGSKSELVGNEGPGKTKLPTCIYLVKSGPVDIWQLLAKSELGTIHVSLGSLPTTCSCEAFIRLCVSLLGFKH